MVKSPLTNVRDTGSIPGQRTKIPNTRGELSPHATNRESPVHCSKDSGQTKGKKLMMRGALRAPGSPSVSSAHSCGKEQPGVLRIQS